MTIKLSLFMLDPVKAHAKYVQEVTELKEFSDAQIEKNRILRKQLKDVQSALKAKRNEHSIVSRKLGEERKANELWSN